MLNNHVRKMQMPGTIGRYISSPEILLYKMKRIAGTPSKGAEAYIEW